jgi:hypothetical protein
MVDVPLQVVAGGGQHPGRLRDICRDAALIDSAASWPLETELVLKMALPGISEAIEAKGRVIRHTSAESGRFGMAVLFTDITPIAALRIDFFVALQTDLKEAGGGPAST